ncbi:MAG: acyl-CoA dehydrogenase C-terminal domain-containing protein [Henriciella sp.]
MAYKAPIEDIEFAYFDLLDVPSILKSTFADELLDRDLAEATFRELAKLCENTLAPLNRIGDEEGCRLERGEVKTPPGFIEAFAAFANGGWIGLNASSEFGGHELPGVLNVIMHEMLMSSNLSFADYIGLPQAAMKAISAHAPDALKEKWLPELVSGKTCATMCLTEPQCGTDLGLIRTKAIKVSDDIYELSGNKIFISAGDHDLTDNILHLVLARIEDSPPGVRGLSLFLCPKLLDDDGEQARNTVHPVRLENKMGYKAASTCEMQFDSAKACLIGKPNRGLHAMFTMVNTARLLVALQGLGTADAAYQAAADYAKDRLQGRALTGPTHPDELADPLIDFPDVRRMLLSTRSFTEGARAIAIWVGAQIDIAEHSQDQDAQIFAHDIVALLTPVIKASFSDFGFRSCNDCMQIFGGHGYIRDTGVEQFVRDARIAQIQEGANAIQALDLIGRKLRSNDQRAWTSFCGLVDDTLSGLQAYPELATYQVQLSTAFEDVKSATQDILGRLDQDPNLMGAAGVDYLRAVALLTFAWMWARILICVQTKSASDPLRKSKTELATYYFERELPAIQLHLSLARLPSTTLMQMPATSF